MTENIFFNNGINFEDEIKLENKLIVFSERRGRKTNTYILDWNLSKEDIKLHLKNLKKKHGCNGSIKTILYQGEEKEVLHLQGELKNEVKEYLVENGENDIEVKV